MTDYEAKKAWIENNVFDDVNWWRRGDSDMFTSIPPIPWCELAGLTYEDYLQ